MRQIICIASILVLLFGCTKSSQTRKSLKGIWKAVSYIETYGGDSDELVSEGGYGLTLEFKSCFIKRNGYCLMNWMESYPTEGEFTESLDYRVTNSGKSLDIRNPNTPENIVNFDIVSIDDQDLILNLTNVSGLETVITLEKQ